MKELPKAYDPQAYEDAIYKRWEDSGFFNPDVCVEKKVTKKSAKPFTIALPPPNVTGTLHMGHAAMLAIEDVLIRYHRMKGDKTLWVPGTDHAAVATESKVEGKLIKEEGFKKPKEELGREKFLERVKQFAQESHDTIVNQSKKMGASLDWSREAYTLDEARNRAVRTVFKKMYDDGLIYRGYRVVNWSVKGQSTCSDDELVYVERPAKLYYFKYAKDFPITIATTRPETKLGDTAVAVNPKGKWKKYVGQTFTVDVGAAKPLNIKIIADESVDDSFGTGALGVTPAHSAVDFDMYSKQKATGNDIGLIQVIGEDGKMAANAGKAYAGLSVKDAREKFVEYLKKEGLLEKEEDITQSVGTSDRFSDIVEPLPKVQWFVDVNKKFVLKHSGIKGVKSGSKVSLKELMQTVVKNSQITIIPDRFNKTYFSWVDNLRDWCISRQIWFGHQIPVWYCSNCNQGIGGYRQTKPKKGPWKGVYIDRSVTPIVSADKPSKCPNCGSNDDLVQDPDTLDTWFSSGLWTFSTLGWPDETKDFKTFHPTSVLETGYDIIFFWVARMILMTTYTLGTIPFETVYLHGLVRDEEGRKMSKTLGNIIDPLDMIAKYGTDATRLSLLIGSTPGNDVKLSEEKIAGFRNFANKLWNIARFMLLTIESPKADRKEPKAKTLADEWILNRLRAVRNIVTRDMESFSFSLAGEELRDFTWGDLADWYLEISKIENDKSDILNYILNAVLKLWHPYMPFVTETIWQEVYGKDAMLMVEKWPQKLTGDEGFAETTVRGMTDFDRVRNIIVGIRSVRSENKIEPAKKLAAHIFAGKQERLIKENVEAIKALARLETLEIAKTGVKPARAVGFVESGVEVYIDLGGAVDTAKEKDRLTKELADISKYISSLEAKLSNKDFVARAPAPVVEGEKKKMEEAKGKQIKLQDQLEHL